MLFSALAITVCAQKNKLTEEQQIAFDQHFINANRYMMLKMPDEVIKEARQALAIRSDVGALAYLLGQVYLQKGLLADAEKYTLDAVQLEPDNYWYKRQLGEIYRQQKAFKKAGDLYGEMYRKSPQSLSHLYDATYMYVMGRDLDKALKMLNEAEKHVGLNEDIIKQKQSIYLTLNKPDKAIKEVQKLVNASPQNTQYLGMLADIYLAQGDELKANEIYRKILSIDPANGYALLSLADDYRNKKNLTEWFNYTLSAVKSPSLDVKSKLKAIVELMSSRAFGADQQKKNYELAEALTRTNDGEASAWMLLGDLYAQDTKFREAHEQYEKAAAIEPSNYSIWRQMILCSNELRDHAMLVEDCRRAVDLFPNEGLFYAYYTFGALQLKRYQDCIDMAKRGLEVSEEQKPVLLQLYVAIGDAANFLKQYGASDSAFEAALAIDARNTYALNNYAYFLSLRKTNLDKAAELSLLSIEIEGGNPSYYDTYGWILFAQKKYREARVQIEKALALSPKNGEVLDHYGDILYWLGDVNMAVEQWKKAKEEGADTPILEKKIKEKKWYE